MLIAVIAAAPVFATPRLVHVAHWQMRDGLPSNKVMAAIQSRDGYIWAGTFEGLVRFDGLTFTRFDAARVPGMLDTSVTALYEASDRVLWIGHDSGAITTYRDGKFDFYRGFFGSGGTRIQNFACDARGDVWALDVSGHLLRPRDGTVLTPEFGGSRGIFAMGSLRSGDVWIIARGKLSLLKHGVLEPVPLAPRMYNYIHGACAASDGGLWVIAAGHLWKYSTSGWSADLGVVPTGETPVFTLVELSDGRLVGGTLDNGGFILDSRMPATGQRIGISTGFPSDWISSVFQDNEGGIWLATGTSGLCRLGRERIHMLCPPDSMHARPALAAMSAKDGAIWITTEGSGVYRFQDGQWSHFAQTAGVGNPYVWSAAQDAGGRIWIGTWGSGVQYFDGQRFVASNDAFAETAVAAMIPARRGGVLVGALQGAYWCDRDHAEWIEKSSVRRFKNVRAIIEEPDGSLWLGCHGDGLGHVVGLSTQSYTHADGLSSDFVDCLYRDSAGVLWIGTHGGGLNRLKSGRFARISSLNGLADNSIEHIEEDGDGNFWMSSKAGVLRVALADLNACADRRISRVTCITYGLSDGLTTLNCSGALQPAGAKLPDGRLIFSFDEGVAVIDPSDIKRNPVPPRVSLESCRVDGVALFDGQIPASRLEIGPGQSRIEIKYTALTYNAPDKVVFRRQLFPLEKDPQYVGGDRLAVYNYVPPGRYTFRVTAENNDGIWNTVGQSLTLVVHPYFWQTLWFKIGLGNVVLIAAVSSAWSAGRRRMRRRLERVERERAVDRERARIANDMHDDLGAHLTRITMLSETAQREKHDSERLKQALQQIYDTAGNITRSMDEIVWAVNPKHDTFESLVAYFEKFTVDFVRAFEMRCRLDIPLEFPEWRPSSEVRHNLFLCLKEALNNVVRHARVDTVTVSIKVENDTCTLAIANDGTSVRPGWSANANRFSSGNGLSSMQSRMSQIGGSCDVKLDADGACLVVLKLPLRVSSVDPGGGIRS